jgi:hypothetical protein
MLLNGGKAANGPLLSPVAFRTLTTPVLSDYAFGFRVKSADGSPALWHGGSIAGFKARIEAKPDEGFGVILLTNGIDDMDLMSWIVETVRRAYHGQDPTSPPPLPAPAPSADTFAGTYRDAAGNALTVRSADGGMMIDGASAISLRRIGPDIFAAPIDAADADAYIFTPEGVSHGAVWFARASARPSASEYRALVGHYSSHNPEGPDNRIFVRNGELMMRSFGEGAKGDTRLLATPDGSYRPSAPAGSPERYRFDTLIDGHMLRMLASGQPVYRVDTP